MPVRLYITIDEEELDEAYKAAAGEPWRKSEAREWSVTESEDWPG